MRKLIIIIIAFLLPSNIVASSLSLYPEPAPLRTEDRSVFTPIAAAGPPKLSIEMQSSRYSPLSRGIDRGSGGEYLSSGDTEYSVGGIIARNLLLPGLGQRKLGQKYRSRIYFVLEGAAWVGLGAFLWQHHSRTEAYEDYAVAYAGVRGTGLSEDYYETIGNYTSSDGPGGYNEYVMREARDMYYPDQEAIESYYEANSITGEDSWRWLTESTYNKYNSLRKGANSSERRAVYSLFFMLGMRLISNIDAVRTIMTSSGQQEETAAGGISLDIEQTEHSVSMVVNRPF